MQNKRKNIIRYALDHDIEDINTYSGYKGDLIVKITSKERNSVLAIRKHALELDMLEVVIKQNPVSMAFEIYCVTPDDNVYHVKSEDELEIKKHHHEKDDIWHADLK